MATKQELEAQVIDQQRIIADLESKIKDLSEGILPSVEDDKKFQALKDEYSKLVDKYTDGLKKIEELKTESISLDETVRAVSDERDSLREELDRAINQLDSIKAKGPIEGERMTAEEVHRLVHQRNISFDAEVVVLKR